MTKLRTTPDHHMSITCRLCKHHSMLEVANLILVIGGDATAHDVRQKFRCQKCRVKGNNTYQIVWRGNSDIALDGAGVRIGNV
jgi:transposase-like protein